MSDMRKLLKIMESVPPVIVTDPQRKDIQRDATVVINPRVGGGVGRFMEYTTEDSALIDIKGVAKEFSKDDFTMPERDLQNGNDWFHMTVKDGTAGTSNDKPEFRPGDMIKIADVYGTVIGPGFGTFIGYGTTGEDCIVLFDGKQIIVPVENVAAVLEQDAKDSFDQMDNDGNLSPMSFGSDNVKIEQPQTGMSREPAMDQRDEFSKWMAAVEEAMEVTSPAMMDAEAPANNCGCAAWNCPVCFPDEQGAELGQVPADAVVIGGQDIGAIDAGPEVCPTCGHHHGSDEEHGELEVVGDTGTFDIEMEEDDDAIAAFKAAGGTVQQLPYMNRPRKPGQTFGSKHIGGLGQNQRDLAGHGRKTNSKLEPMRNPVVAPGQGPVITDPNRRLFTPKDQSVDEEENTFVEKPKSGKGVKLGNIVQSTKVVPTGGQNSPMTYGEDNLDEDDLELEATKSTKTKTQTDLDFDFGDDILGNQNPLANVDQPAGFDDEPVDDVPGGPAGINALPRSSAANTQQRVAGITPSETMRDLMNRINPDAGMDEPERPETPTDAMVVRTASDVPAILNHALRAAGVENPEWHTVNNLPGMNNRNIRGMGRNVFSAFTSTPQEDILTIANVEGQGPNTDAEIRSVAGWLRNNAEDLGPISVDYGTAIPGYRPDVREFRANGIRFHLVRDPAGQYIYAYPDQDARTHGAQQGQLPGRERNMPTRGQPPRLREVSPTLFEQIQWDEELRQVKGLFEEIIEESTLSRVLGKKKGGQQLVRFLHRKHKLSNEAELEPVKFTKELLWSQFKSNPDDFVIVSGDNGAAGIKPSKKSFDDYIAAKTKKGETPNPGRNAKLQYQIIAFTDDGDQVDPELLRVPTEPGEEPGERDPDPTVQKARMGKTIGSDLQNQNNTFKLLNDQIGPIRTVWISGFGGYRGDPESLKEPKGSVERDKMAKRAELKKSDDLSEQDAMKKVFNRVRPVLKKLGDQASSEITRAAQRAINGGNFDAGQKMMQNAQKLKDFMIQLDRSGDIPLDTSYGSPTKIFTRSIIKSLEVASGSRSGSDQFREWLNGAAKGNAVALQPVLDGLRQTLVTLSGVDAY